MAGVRQAAREAWAGAWSVLQWPLVAAAALLYLAWAALWLAFRGLRLVALGPAGRRREREAERAATHALASERVAQAQAEARAQWATLDAHADD